MISYHALTAAVHAQVASPNQLPPCGRAVHAWVLCSWPLVSKLCVHGSCARVLCTTCACTSREPKSAAPLLASFSGLRWSSSLLPARCRHTCCTCGVEHTSAYCSTGTSQGGCPTHAMRAASSPACVFPYLHCFARLSFVYRPLGHSPVSLQLKLCTFSYSHACTLGGRSYRSSSPHYPRTCLFWRQMLSSSSPPSGAVGRVQTADGEVATKTLCFICCIWTCKWQTIHANWIRPAGSEFASFDV